MYRGYVKLWRKSIDSAVFQNPELWKLWCLCLMRANHKEKTVHVEGIIKPITVKPGQFVTGRYDLHNSFYPIKRKKQKSSVTVWNWIVKLQEIGNLVVNSYNKYSIISICNWDTYQCEKTPVLATDLQQTCNNLTTDLQQTCTNKNDIRINKNEKNVEKPAATLSLPSLFEEIEKDFSFEELENKTAFLDYWTEKKPNGKKERWQMQKVFDVNRRFRTWLRNNEQWNNNGYQKPKPEEHRYNAGPKLKKI